MKKNYPKLVEKFEFILHINGNIICQRFFNVKNPNEKVTHSLEMKECVDNCVNIIKSQFRDKSEDFLWDSYNLYQEIFEEIPTKNNYENEDFFDFEIKSNGYTLATRRFSGNDFPPKVRYSVDIRKIIPEIISEIQYYMTLKEGLEQEYLDTVL